MTQLDEQALKIDEYFQKIINQIDVDTEYHINSFTSLEIKCEKENEYISHLNEKRNEFIEELKRIKQTNLDKFQLINSFVYLEIDSLFDFMKTDRKNGFLLIADYYLSDEEAKSISDAVLYLDRFSKKNLKKIEVNLSSYYIAKLIINAIADNKSIMYFNKDQFESVAHIYMNGRGDYPWNDSYVNLDVHFDLEQFSKLEILHLQENSFKNLKCLNDKKLLNAPCLKILDLSNSRIELIEPGTFDNLKSLVELNLSNNLIKHLKSKQFVNCDSLRSIELIKNDLETIDSDSFEGLPNLEKISITIHLKKLLKQDIFEKFNGTLKIFKLDLSIYEKLNKSFNDNWIFLNLEKLQNIEELELEMNNKNMGFNFHKIPNNLNKLKKFIIKTSIWDLDLNQIFNRFYYIREIDIILNKSFYYLYDHYKFVNKNGFRLIEYTSLDDGIFEKKIKDLTTLENILCVNFYTEKQMSSKIHKSNELMNQLDLTKLELSRFNLDRDCLTDLKLLKTVTLNYIEFENGFDIEDALKNIKKLEKLELWECLFEGNIDEKVFSLMPHLKSLSITKNIEKINKNMFNNLNELEVLELNLNPLTHVESGLFMGLVNLKIIDLSSSGIELIDKNAFEQSKNLETINLSMNKLKNVDELFGDLLNLKEIDLSSNSLQSFNFNDIKKLTNIRKIDLRGNGSIWFDDHELSIELINLGRLAIFCEKSPWNFEQKDMVFC